MRRRVWLVLCGAAFVARPARADVTNGHFQVTNGHIRGTSGYIALPQPNPNANDDGRASAPNMPSVPGPRDPELDDGGLNVAVSGAPAVGPSFGNGIMGIIDIGGGVGGREKPTGVLRQVGIGIPIVILERSGSTNEYGGAGFSLFGRYTWRKGDFELGFRFAPVIRFGSYGELGDKDRVRPSSQLGVDLSPELFYRVTRYFWVGLGIDHFLSLPTFTGVSGLPAVVVGPGLKLLLIPFN